MPSSKFYPSILNILPTENIPASLGPVKDGVESLFENLFYRNLQTDKTASGDSAFYRLDLIAYKRIGFEIPGTGFALVVNPDDSGLNITPISISLGYEWQILKHIKNFDISSFSEAPDAFFQLFLDLTDLTPEEIIEEAIAVFFDGDDPLDDFITRFNQVQNTSIDLNTSPIQTDFEHIIEQIEALQIDTFKYILEDLIQSVNSFEEIIANIKKLFKKWLGEIDLEDIKRLLIPQASLSINDLSIGIVFPTNVFRQVDDTIVSPNPAPTYLPLDDGNGNDVPSVLKFIVGSLNYTTEDGIRFDGNFTFDEFQTSEILRSGFCIGFDSLKMDLSRTTNIPEATADGRPNDFIGVYLEEANIIFPAFWKHDQGASSGVLKGRNLLIGTGGISGNIQLEAINSGNPTPLISAKFGQGFEVSLDSFALEFQQNAIIGSDIGGTMKIPGFKNANNQDAELDIDVHIGQGGDFSVTVTEAAGFDLCIPGAVTINVRSASVGREDDRFFLSVSGQLSFADTPLGSIMSGAIDFQEIIIWDDGQFEIKGGGLELPKAVSFDKKPLKMAITAIHLGSDEREYVYQGVTYLRNYKYFGFDGMVKMDPGGVDAKGQGIKFYFSDDNNYNGRHVFLRIDSLKVDLVFPGDKDPDSAAVVINGWLSIKDAPDGAPGSEYAGGVMVKMPQTGAGGSVQMKFNPKVPYFIIDVEIEPKKAIPLGNTGLGLYGFRGLLGKHYVASKTAAGVPESDPWWKYYKSKIASQYKEGVQVDKFAPTGGFAVGLGVSLATSTDGGKVFSSKIFLLLSLRELLMLQGQAAILKERIQLGDPNDPPFFALIVISKESIEAALGVNYLIPDDKATPGSTATVQGVLELGFFFKDSSAWYLNIGRDLPESYRIQVRLFDLFDCYFYFMLNAKGIRTGAGASFEWGDKWGPLEAYLYAYLDIAAKVAFKPKQFGGSIQLGGGIDITIFGLSFGITAAAGLAAEVPEPFNISGFVEACFKAVGKEWCAKFEFSWERNPNVDTTRIGVINNGDAGIPSVCQAVNIQTQQIFPVNYIPNSSSELVPPRAYGIGSNLWKGTFDDFIVPMDSFIDLDFTNGLNPIGNPSTAKFGIMGGGADFTKIVAPQKGKTPQVYHNFKVEEIVVYAWDPSPSIDEGQWVEYDIYGAITQWVDPTSTNTPPLYNTAELKQGYWQMEAPNKYNKLRILSQTPLSYTTQINGPFIPENNGITSESIFCDTPERAHTCINFANYIPTRKNEVTDWTTDFTLTGLPIPSNSNALNLISGAYPTQYLGLLEDGSLNVFGNVSFVVTGADGGIVTAPLGLNGNSIALGLNESSAVEINFNEAMVCIDFNVTTYTNQVTVEYYRLVVDPNSSGNNLMEELITSTVLTQSAVNSGEQQYLDEANPVDKMIVRSGVYPEGEGVPVLCEPELTMEGEQLLEFLNTLAVNDQLLTSFTLNDGINSSTYDGVFFNSPLYQWGGTNSGPDLNYSVTSLGTTIQLNVTDGNGYDCTTTLVAGGRFNWATVDGFTNLRKDPAYPQAGPNYHFLIDAVLSGGGSAVISGHSTCHNVLNCYADLSTWLFNVCYLNVADYAFNQTVLDSTENTAQVDSMMDAIQNTIQPIWRPNTTFAVKVKVKEAVSGGGTATHDDTYFYGFKTAGPIGHFHRFLDTGGNEVIREDYQSLLDQDQEESYVLRNLKPYINYAVSYPNANGDLLNAKPLFYGDPKILLFFTRPYVYHMFEGWSVWNGSAAITAGMSVDIRDAVEPETPPVGVVSWQFENHPMKDKDSQILNNMVSNALPTGCEPETLNEFGVHAQIDVTGLKPLKLYTAMVFNNYSDGLNSAVKREVHKYPFRTSRYANFEEQIQSYILATDQNVPIKTAIYDVEMGANGSTVDAATIVAPSSTLMLTKYADKIERILQGALKVGTLQPPISTEFNFVKDGSTLLGVWIRNPEPFNDPKIPRTDIESSIELTIDSSGAYMNFFSKDCREVFITNGSLNLPGGEFEFSFHYLEWSKVSQQFETVTTEIVQHSIPSSI